MRKSLLLAAVLVSATPVQAQNSKDLVTCAAIPRDAERLACYDKAVAAGSFEARAAAERRATESARIKVAEAVEASRLAAVQAAESARAAAELAAKKKADFGAEGIEARGAERFIPNPDEVQAIDAGIAEVLVNRSSQNVFLLDNGQMWRQVDAVSIPNVRNGDRVMVSKGPLGGYKLQFVRQKRFVVVKRLR